MIHLIGGGGFVGAAYARLFARLGLAHRTITRANRANFAGETAEIVLDADGNSSKPLAEREPLVDFDRSVRAVAQSLEDFPCDTYVLLSSGDVYPDAASPASTAEDQTIDPARLSRYGRHKLLAEALVRGQCRNWLVLRLGGFVGPGLKKNAVFDMLNDAPVWLAPGSELQYLSTDRAAAMVWGLVERGVRREIVNLGAEGVVQLGRLHREIGSRSRFQPGAPLVRYELALDKLRALHGGLLPESRAEVAAFVAAWRRELAS